MKVAQLALIAVMTLAFTWALPARAGPVSDNLETEMCDGHLVRLRGPDLVTLLTGRTISLSLDGGVCPGGFRVTSPWYLELQADGHFVLRVDRGLTHGGLYSFNDDQLCIDDVQSCAKFYHDEVGRIYMFGVPNPNSVPTVINGVALSRN